MPSEVLRLLTRTVESSCKKETIFFPFELGFFFLLLLLRWLDGVVGEMR